MDLVRTLLQWVDIPSVTGAEGDYGEALCRSLAEIGLSVERQELAPGRFNVLARARDPQVVFCTHQDTVPPWIAPREDREFVHGRGSCDAKGQAVAMIAAARELLDSGEDRFGLLFTVGEETDSAGAALANERMSEPWSPRAVLVGEPTGLRWVRAHKGIFKAHLVATGEAGHSSQEALPSAIHALVLTLQRLLAERWGEHPSLGTGTLNIGRVEGGVAPNVVAPSAAADLLLRIVESAPAVRARIERCLEPGVRLELPSKSHGPTEFAVPQGEEGIAVAFGTDAPHLSRWGKPMLFGAGSITDAHTDHEKVRKRDLEEASKGYARAAREVLAKEGVACRDRT
jgi:acetylornithine deacetylase